MSKSDAVLKKTASDKQRDILAYLIGARVIAEPAVPYDFGGGEGDGGEQNEKSLHDP